MCVCVVHTGRDFYTGPVQFLNLSFPREIFNDFLVIHVHVACSSPTLLLQKYFPTSFLCLDFVVSSSWWVPLSPEVSHQRPISQPAIHVNRLVHFYSFLSMLPCRRDPRCTPRKMLWICCFLHTPRSELTVHVFPFAWLCLSVSLFASVSVYANFCMGTRPLVRGTFKTDLS